MNSLVGDCIVADTSEVNLDIKFEIVAGVTQIWPLLCVCVFCGSKFLQFEDTTVFYGEPIFAIQQVENTTLPQLLETKLKTRMKHFCSRKEM